MSRLYTYIVQQDTGLAPNPYWGICTLAVCTPNHQGSKVKPGDFVAGFLSKARQHRFLYAMEVSDVIGLHEYYLDSRFDKKKPNLKGSWKQRCGDNFYSRGSDGEWIQHRNRFHIGEEIKQQDTRFAKVFLAKRFWYLGRSASLLPEQYASLAGGRGARVNHDPDVVAGFLEWFSGTFSQGIADLPNDNPDLASTDESTLRSCSSPVAPATSRPCS